MASPAAADTSDDLPERIDAFAADYVERQNLAGVSVAVIRDGEVLHTAGYGHDSTGEAVTADTRMQTASVSKSFTAMAVMRLVEDGEVDLDTPVQEYLDEFEPVDPRAETITVRQLMDQTSGMASEGLVSPHRRAFDTAEEAVAVLAGMELANEPGARHVYFNGNYWMLARMVQVVTGESYGSYLDRAVLDPLGISDSTSVADADGFAGVEGLVDGHVNVYGIPVPRKEPAAMLAGSGDVVTTAADMARWLAPFTDGGRTAEGEQFVSAGTVEELLTPSSPEGNYALGWRPVPGEDRMSHSGTDFTYLAYQTVTDDGLGVAVLNNTRTIPYDSAQPLAVGIIDLVEGESPEQPLPIHRLVDYGILLLTVLTVALGIRRLGRDRAWARRLSTRPTWRLVLRLAPRLLPLVFIGWFAWVAIASIADGTDVGYVLSIGAGMLWWPPSFTVWICIAALLNLATILVRAHHLRRERSGEARFERRE